jgi:ribonuclease T1
MRHWLRLGLVILALVLALSMWNERSSTSGSTAAPASGDAAATSPASHAGGWAKANLPPEAIATLAAIASGGSFPHARDGVEFYNREQRLPQRPRGYYREYTVETPGASDRGARRIVTGGDPPEVYYYTGDHYRTFIRIEATDDR